MPNRRKTDEEYRQQLKNKGSGVTPQEEYKDARTKIKHKCKCGNEWLITPKKALEIKSCKKCAKRKTNEQYLKQLKELKIKVVPLESYIAHQIKILHKCECGTEWKVTPADILNGKKCIKHNARFKGLGMHSHERFLEMLKENEIIDVIPLEEYKGYDHAILFRCRCGSKWRTIAKNVLKGGYCGCIISKGEVLISDFLIEKGFDFEKQHTFPDLKTKRTLPFDFALFSGKKIVGLIEYHGDQHFIYNPYFHKTKEEFTYRQKLDHMKKDYAQKKDIPLIEITYKNKAPLETLEKELKALGISKPIGHKYEQLSLF